MSLALQLIEKGLVDDGSVDRLADELGISPRQLSRLFKLHLGASPLAVAQTRRLHFAKQLIDETSLPMAEIAFAAGFGSLRRFNAVLKSTYKMTPLQLRRRVRSLPSVDGEIRITLNYRPPFDWRALLAFLAVRAIPGVESITADSYSRSIDLHGQRGEFELKFIAGKNTAILAIQFPDSRQLLAIVDQVRKLFDLRANSSDIEQHLARDKLLAPLLRANPGLRVPGCWNGFEVAVRSIVGQQVSVKAASTLMARIAASHGVPYQSTNSGLTRLFPSASVLVEADLSGLGITGQRIAAIRDIARLVLNGELVIDGSMPTEQFAERICQIKGIGEWTAQYIALRALNDPDAFPHGDLILQRAAGKAGKALTAKQLLARAENWHPWRAYAVMQLWKKYVNQMNQKAVKT